MTKESGGRCGSIGSVPLKRKPRSVSDFPVVGHGSLGCKRDVLDLASGLRDNDSILAQAFDVESDGLPDFNLDLFDRRAGRNATG